MIIFQVGVSHSNKKRTVDHHASLGFRLNNWSFGTHNYVNEKNPKMGQLFLNLGPVFISLCRFWLANKID